MIHVIFKRQILWHSAAAALLGLTAGCASLEGRGGFAFGVLGDMPYTKVQEAEYARVITAMNAADLAFVAHIGDFQFDARPYNQNPSLASMPWVVPLFRAIQSGEMP